MVNVTSSPFGSRSRTRILLTLELLSQSYPRELSRLLGTPLSAVQGALRALEKDGLVAGRAVGRTRLYSLNPGYFAIDRLRPYLRRLAEPELELARRVESMRRRPRRSGKEL